MVALNEIRVTLVTPLCRAFLHSRYQLAQRSRFHFAAIFHVQDDITTLRHGWTGTAPKRHDRHDD